MATASFRDSMNSLGWARREQPVNTNRQNPIVGTLQKLNPFSNEGFVRLPTTEGEGEAPGAPFPARTRREEEEGWFACKFPAILAPPHIHPTPWTLELCCHKLRRSGARWQAPAFHGPTHPASA